MSTANSRLFQVVHQFKFFAAPAGREPRFRDEKQHGLAAVSRLIERALPPFACRNAAMRVDIEENFVFPAVTRQPIAQGDSLGVVSARMAQEYARHVKVPDK